MAVIAVPQSAKGSTIKNQSRNDGMDERLGALFKIWSDADAQHDLALAAKIPTTDGAHRC